MRYEVPVTRLSRATVNVGGTGGATVGDVTYGHVVRNDGRTLLHVLNTSGSSRIVTVRYPNLVDGNQPTAKQLTIPGGTDVQCLVGPFPDSYSEDRHGFQVLPNPGFETWASGTDPSQWLEVLTGGVVERVTQGDLLREGSGSCCRLRRTEAGDLYVYTDPAVRFHLPESSRCVVEGWARREGNTASTLGVQMVEALAAPDVYLAADGVTWSTTPQDVVAVALSEQWQFFRVPFTARSVLGTQYGLQLTERTANVGARALVDDWRVGLLDPPTGFQVDVSGSGLYLRAYRLA